MDQPTASTSALESELQTTTAETGTSQQSEGGNETVADHFSDLIRRMDRRSGDGRGFAIEFWDGSQIPAAQAATNGSVPPTLHFTSPDGISRIIRSPGELGFSRAWVSGDLDVEGDLEEALIETEHWRNGAVRPSDVVSALRAARSTGILRRPAPEPPDSEARLNGRTHSLKRDKEAISHHYDVSNRFYELMLGPTMVYSCAYFGSSTESLNEAQTRKLDLICKKLDLKPGERLLDLGCGWGSLLMHAAMYYGTRGVGITLSEEQADLARRRIREARLSDMCEVRVEDYRMVSDGPYDKVASIGMFEHVGSRNLWLYLARVHDLLNPEGRFLNHGIVRTEDAPMSSRSFTQRYVFPDGELHTQGVVLDSLEGARFELLDDESLRPHYAKTLRCWAENLEANRSEVVSEIGVEKERVWRLHNVGAAVAFDEGRLSVHQALLRPLEAQEPLPLRPRKV